MPRAPARTQPNGRRHPWSTDGHPEPRLGKTRLGPDAALGEMWGGQTPAWALFLEERVMIAARPSGAAVFAAERRDFDRAIAGPQEA